MRFASPLSYTFITYLLLIKRDGGDDNRVWLCARSKMRVRMLSVKIGADLLNINAGENRLKRTEAPLQRAGEGLGASSSRGLKNEEGFMEPEFRSAIKLIESKGYQLDDKAMQGLRDFMQNGEGSVEDKLEAIETALAKDMPLKEALLTRLQGFSRKSLLDFLPDTLGFISGGEGGAEPPTSSSIKEKQGLRVRKGTGFGKGIEKMSGSILEHEEKVAPERKEAQAARVKDSILLKEGSLSAGSEGAGLSPGAEYEIERIDELLRSLLNEIDGDSSLSELSEKEGGQEAAQPLSGLDQNLLADLGELGEADMEALASYIVGAASINESFSSRAVLMTEITPRLQGLKRDFEELKLGLTRDLARLTSKDKPISPEETVKTLEKNIERLDRAIMRSEMSLYMDLKGERDLLKLSSKLQEARQLLQEGKFTASKQLMEGVKVVLEKLDYVPSIKKALLLYDTGLEAEMAHEIKDVKGLAEWLGDRAGRYQVSAGTPNSLSSYMRKLGLGAEAENFENMSLSKQKAEIGAQTRDFVSLRGLLKELSTSGAKPLDREAATAMLGRIEAMDLKNKILDTREAQTLSLELPLKLNGSIKNVKVFIQSPQHQRKLDWENFNMFFVLTTERLGELGIKVESLQKNLSVSILNDEAKKLEEGYHFKDGFKKEVEDLGFRLVKMIMEEWRGRTKSSKTEETNEAADDGARAWNERTTGLEEGRFDMRL